MAIKIQQQHIN